MFKFLLNIFKRKKFEYLYFYVLSSEVYSTKDAVRMRLNDQIKLELQKLNKDIVDYEIYSDKQFFENVLIFSTESLQSIYFKPLLLEIYAFMKKEKDSTVFSYKFDKVLFKFFNAKKEERFLTVYKFKINVR